jgi:hypothetical protein
VSRKHFYIGTSSILFYEDKKMWTIHLDLLEMFVILQLKKYHTDALEQDTELCPLCYFPITIAGKEEANLICKFPGFHTSIVFCFSFFLLIHKN